MLKQYSKTWDDVPQFLVLAEQVQLKKKAPPPPPPKGFNPRTDVLTLLYEAIGKYIDVTDRERLAIALWVLHAHVYQNFSHSPRLALLSPTNGCGKSTLLALFKELTPTPMITPDITPAAIFHLVDTYHPTLMLDEMDNADLHAGQLLKIVNTGHSRAGGFVYRVAGNYRVYGPMALAAIGKVLPTPLMKRSIIIDMQRTDRKLPSIGDLENDALLPYLNHRLVQWSQTVTLNSNPTLGMINRVADNWRPLIAIGDSFPKWSTKVRDTAKKLQNTYRDDDAAVNVLKNIRAIVDRDNLDPIFSSEMLIKLHEFEGGDINWSEWRGLKDDQTPKKLTAADLGLLVGRFGIKSKTVWAKGRTKKNRVGGKGYQIADFEKAWAKYDPEPEADTPTHQKQLKRKAA
jgi:hypothetical protein